MSRKVTIAIVGQLPGQFQEVERWCCHLARLRRVDSQRTKSREIPSADHVILLTKFIAHHWTWLVRRSFPANRVHYANGCTGVIDTVRSIARERRED